MKLKSDLTAKVFSLSSLIDTLRAAIRRVSCRRISIIDERGSEVQPAATTSSLLILHTLIYCLGVRQPGGRGWPSHLLAFTAVTARSTRRCGAPRPTAGGRRHPLSTVIVPRRQANESTGIRRTVCEPGVSVCISVYDVGCTGVQRQ